MTLNETGGARIKAKHQNGMWGKGTKWNEANLIHNPLDACVNSQAARVKKQTKERKTLHLTRTKPNIINRQNK